MKKAWQSILERWFALPDGDSEAENRTRNFRIVVWITMGVVTALFSALSLLQASLAPRAMAAIVVIDGCGLFGLYLSGRGWTRQASILFLGVLIARVAYMALDAGGIHSPGMAMFLVFILMAALLLGKVAAAVTAGICAAIAIGLTVAETQGILPEQTVHYGPVAQLLLNLVYIAVMLVVVELIVRSISRSLTRAQRELAERQRVDADHERLVVQLNERVKELRLLHRSAGLLQPERPFNAQLLDEIVNLIPPAWMHSASCEARIRYSGMEVTTAGWRETPWKQVATFRSSEAEGTIEVVYTTEHGAKDEGPFLTEERALIESLAEMLQTHVERDIAERNRQIMEVSLRHSQKMEALGTLAGGIAHDFNNILTAIGGNAELGYADATDASTREAFSEIRAAYYRARDLVKRILIFGRRQESTQVLIRLEQVTREAIQLLKASLPPRIEIRAHFAPDAPSVLADATQMHQIVMNLGTNAAYAMRDRPGILEVEIDAPIIAGADAARLALRPGIYTRLRVGDTGTGMTPEVRERLFEPFFTTKGLDGTGLGLAVVHGIVRDHHGAIDVRSEVGVGTTFSVYLPAAAGDQVLETEPPPTIGDGQRIMYVDDDVPIVVLMSRVLRRLGYEPVCYADPRSALDAFRDSPFAYSAVMTDMAMPGITGVQLAAAVHEVRPDIPVALVSGYGAGDRELIHTHHVAAVIQKPASTAEISRVLGQLMGRRDRATADR